jgi:hypothetical protein
MSGCTCVYACVCVCAMSVCVCIYACIYEMREYTHTHTCMYAVRQQQPGHSLPKGQVRCGQISVRARRVWRGDDDDVNQQGEKLHILLSHVYMHTNDYMDGMR